MLKSISLHLTQTKQEKRKRKEQKANQQSELYIGLHYRR